MHAKERIARESASAGEIVALVGLKHSVTGDTLCAGDAPIVLERMALPGRSDIGALRLRTLGVKDVGCADFPDKDEDGKYDPSVVLDFDYTVLMPRRG